jgi:uncharacterized protein RhaS with RHS repeats
VVTAGACVVLLLPGAAAAGSRTVVWTPGSWSWFGDPRAVHVGGPEGSTYAGWVDWSGDIVVGAFDPDLGSLGDEVIGHAYHDDHGNPSLLIEPDGRLTAFWSGHNGAPRRAALCQGRR